MFSLFHSDGTSIVLLDDVGQIYLINTGEGESQKDAKYDQVFQDLVRTVVHNFVPYLLFQNFMFFQFPYDGCL